MVGHVTFVDAVKTSQWVRRKSWLGSWMLVPAQGPVLLASRVKWDSLTKADLIATDWISFVSQDDPDPDGSEIRFKLMELE